MLTELNYDLFTKMLLGAVEVVKEKHEYFSGLDAVIGDGDHGVTLLRAMLKMEDAIKKEQGKDIKKLVDEIGWALLGVDGGATGPLMGSIFLGMAEALIPGQNLDCQNFAKMFESGLANIQQQTKAKVGDKTMMDALIPAVEAIRKKADAGGDIPAMLDAGYIAATKGAEATKNMVAHFGRAKNQGDRTLGHADPGATSFSYILKGYITGLS